MTHLPEEIRNKIFFNVDADSIQDASSGLNITNESIIEEIKSIDSSFSIRSHLLSLLAEYRERKSFAYRLYLLIKDMRSVNISMIRATSEEIYFLDIEVLDKDFSYIQKELHIPFYGEGMTKGDKPDIICGHNVYAYKTLTYQTTIRIECKDLSLGNSLMKYLCSHSGEFFFLDGEDDNSVYIADVPVSANISDQEYAYNQ